jgi:hypothetical protein
MGLKDEDTFEVSSKDMTELKMKISQVTKKISFLGNYMLNDPAIQVIESWEFHVRANNRK